MKRILAILTSAMMIFSLAACSESTITTDKMASDGFQELVEDVNQEITEKLPEVTQDVLEGIYEGINNELQTIPPENNTENNTEKNENNSPNNEDASIIPEDVNPEDELNLGTCEPEFEEEFIPNPELTEWVDVVFVDVGQGDSAFIITPNKDVILIDAGVESDAKAIIDAMDKYEFENIDLMILTHPHADHIAGAVSILNTYDVEEVLMCSYVATSKTFEKLIDTLEIKDIDVTQAYVGQTYNIDDVDLEILAVDTDKKDNNNSSIVSRVEFGTISFMFTGDAEEITEREILKHYDNLSTNILKAGHHGSSTSTCEDFLDAVFPEYVIVSCGKDNSYGHPHKEFIDLMEKYNRPYFTTVDYGTITVQTNGEDIIMTGEKE